MIDFAENRAHKKGYQAGWRDGMAFADAPKVMVACLVVGLLLGITLGVLGAGLCWGT